MAHAHKCLVCATTAYLTCADCTDTGTHPSADLGLICSRALHWQRSASRVCADRQGACGVCAGRMCADSQDAAIGAIIWSTFACDLVGLRESGAAGGRPTFMFSVGQAQQTEYASALLMKSQQLQVRRSTPFNLSPYQFATPSHRSNRAISHLPWIDKRLCVP